MTKFKILLIVLFSINISYAQQNSKLKWWNPAKSEFPVVENQAWPHEVASRYQRLPDRAQKSVRKPVWRLSKNSAGLSIRFWSNAKNIVVKYKLKGGISMPHMPATGVSGLDLYSKSYNGEWMRCWGKYSLAKLSKYDFAIEDKSDSYKKYGREYQLFLPLYNSVETLEIGISEDSFLKALPIRNEKPIVAYGTSICQGACASRPGMAWTNILERRLERPVINLGFSGNGKLESEIIDLLTEIDAKLYILDCLPNLNPQKDDTYNLAINAVKKLKAKRPDAAVILTDHIGYADYLTNEKSKGKYTNLNQSLDSAFNTLISEGYTKVFHLTKEELQFNFDMYVDIIHPNDYGMVAYADAYEPLIRKVLHETSGEISTTIPCTQSRDIAVYKWEERHQAILKRNKEKAPKVCLFGNSIVNFWGGKPESVIVNGKDSWKKIMKPLGVQNFGFGWDRIENVLWRVYHDELDGFEAEKIVLMIGTNNLHLNSDSEIIKGLQKLIKAIRIRQPKSEIVMIGILPRRGKVKRVDTINSKISQLAEVEGLEFKIVGDGLLAKDGKIDESLFTDGLHPNGKGYMIIAKKLKHIIKN